MIKNVITYIFILLTLYSCGTKKSIVEYRDIVKTDTIYKGYVKEYIKATHDTITIDNPCDTTGVLKPFTKVLKTSNANISLENKNGSIALKIDIDSLVNERISLFKSQYKQDVQNKRKRSDKNRSKKT